MSRQTTGSFASNLKENFSLWILQILRKKNYLKATGIEVGLLINFGKSMEIKRKFVNAVVK
ncbi:MAG: GxxExxY protein [Campylobacterota bacterium]|nr:GxxExxY protein [Campylobacterota bacterium]